MIVDASAQPRGFKFGVSSTQDSGLRAYGP